MRTIKTYSKGAPFYNALIRRVDCFRVARHPTTIAHWTLPNWQRMGKSDDFRLYGERT